MANAGFSVFDMGMPANTRAKTTTAQYRWVCGGSGTSLALGPDIPNTLGMSQYPVGIVQNRPTANSTQITVRTGGSSKCKCDDTVVAFQWAKVDASLGGLSHGVLGGQTVLTANIVFRGVAGQPLEDGVTNQVVEMLVRPFVTTFNLT